MPFPTTLLADEDNASVSIGRHCHIHGTYIHAKGSIEIGDNCMIGGV